MRTGCGVVRVRRASRSGSGALITNACSWLAAWILTRTAARRATRSARIDSTWPSRVLGVPVAVAASTARAAASASTGSDTGVGLAARSTDAPVGPIDFDDPQPRTASDSSQPSAVAAGALDPERHNGAQPLAPSDQPSVAARIGRERVASQDPAQVVDRDRNVGVQVGIDANRDLDVVVCDGGHAISLIRWWHAPTERADKTVMGPLARLLQGHAAHAGDMQGRVTRTERQISARTPRSVSQRVNSDGRPRHPFSLSVGQIVGT